MPITPQHWGAPKWFGIHVTCYFVDTVYRQNIDKQTVLHRWLRDSADMLPCNVCTHHFLQFMQSNPLPAIQAYASGETPYLRWSIRAHNAVNKRNGKPEINEETIIQSYKSGVMYGLHSQAQPTQLQADFTSSNTISFEIATYVLATLLALCLGGMGLYFILRSKRRQKIPELSD